MAALQLALILLTTVLASAILDQLIPKLSLPLIQIALGIVVALLSGERINITLNPELFLVLFIAPLLFHEALSADNVALWKNRRSMLSFAIGLVVAIVLAVGFALHFMVPSIPLAAAFALGAALGPTDPIAVASISEKAEIPERQKTILKGESLLNDASGIVSFQFAVAAVVTGSFSLSSAVGAFFLEFFGALAIGVVLGFALGKFASFARDFGLENTTFHVALELLTPFIAYLLGEATGVSGVILVVACGLTMSFMPSTLGPSRSRMNIVSTSVWQVIEFSLNGVVFVLLGTQLPQAFGDFWIDDGIDNFHLTIYVIVITLLMHAIRFAWSMSADAVHFSKTGQKPNFADRLRSALVLTLSGSKGAITLAIMFSLPIYINTGTSVYGFPQRDLLIFLASGVILISLLLATFLVPLLAPRTDSGRSKQRELDAEAKAEILRRVVEELTASQTPKNRVAIGQVIERYNDRISRVKEEEDLESSPDTPLRIDALNWEIEYILDLIERDEVPPVEGYRVVNRLSRVVSMHKQGKQRTVSVFNWFKRTMLVAGKLRRKVLRKLPGDESSREESKRVAQNIQVLSAKHVVEKLQRGMMESEIPSEQISNLIIEYRRKISLLSGPSPSVTAIARKAEPDLEATRLGLRIELEQIQIAYEEGRLSRAGAQKMRQNVYLMQVDLEDEV